MVRRANDVEYGLCATLWSENVSTVHRVARQLKVEKPLPHIPDTLCDMICVILLFKLASHISGTSL